MKNKKRFSFIRYSNCWEDSQILKEALDIKAGQTGLSIASAGDNTLALLLGDPKKIYAFDLNKTQLYCMELKILAIKKLEYDKLLCFLGIYKHEKRLATYRKIRKNLSLGGQEFFDENVNIIEKGIIHIGKFERYFQIFRKYIVPLFTSKKRFADFASLENKKEQELYWEKYINNKRLKIIFNLYFGTSIMGRFGRDKSFYDHIDDKESSAQKIKDRFELGIGHTINKSNPYLNYIAKGNYNKNALPEYLQKENYLIIKENLHKIKILHSDLISIKDMKFDFFNLSDIFEYMGEEEFKKNIEKLDRLSNKGARIAYWNMQNNQYIKDPSFVLEKEKSDKLFLEDRAYFYKDFLIYRKR